MPNKLLVVRNDKLGDFMLAWPVFALIKHYWPQVQLSVLVPRYTSPIATLCPWIDQIIIDESESAWRLSGKLREHRFDAMLTLFSTGRVGVAGWLAGIPYRLAPATKAAQLFYTHRHLQRRSRSEKPEYAYNLDLAYRLLADLKHLPMLQQTFEQSGDWLPPVLPRPLLVIDETTAQLRSQVCQQHGLPADNRLIFIHPGSGGSANNLRPAQYAQLANLLASNKALNFVISAGPGERHIATEVANAIDAPVAIYDSSAGLAEFARTLQLADLFLSGSTGPLHIAAALDRPTAAFYPGHRSATPLRWQTLNAPHKRLAFTPPPGNTEREVATIDIDTAAKRISEHFFNE